MVKYSKENIDKGDKFAITFAKKHRLDLIEIPEEFKDVTTDDMSFKYGKKNRRSVIRTKHNRDLTNYDAWRTHDRSLIKGSPQETCVSKILLPPALLVRAFG